VVTLNFIKKVYFRLSSFSVYRWSVLLVFRNSILISKFISFIFQKNKFMREEKERGLLDFDVERVNHCLHLF